MSRDFRNLFIASDLDIGDVAVPTDPDSPSNITIESETRSINCKS
jgi:hypothetical protein